MAFRRIATLKSADDFAGYLASLGVDLQFDREVISGADSPLAQTFKINGFTIGNRFSILPMEGWDGTLDGRPSDLTVRRWKHFGESGAKLIWGGEAVAVRHDGRANPNPLMSSDATSADLANLLDVLVDSHREIR